MMKAALLFTLIVGAAVAKPSVDDKLVQLLKKFLDEKDQGAGSGNPGPGPGPGPIKTTMFDGLGMEPIEIFGAHADLSKPLKAEEVEDGAKEVIAALDEVEDIADNIVGKLQDLVASGDEKNLQAVGDALVSNVLPLFESGEADLEGIMAHLFFGLLQGAIGGTVGANPNEPPVDLNGPKDKVVNDVLNKAFQAMIASQTFLEIAWETLTAEVEGEALQPCDAVFVYLEGEGELDGDDVTDALAQTLQCIRNNMELIRERLGNKAGGSELLPEASPLPLPRIMVTNALVQYVAGSAWWAQMSVHAVLYTIDAELNGEKKKKAYSMKENRMLQTKAHFRRGHKY